MWFGVRYISHLVSDALPLGERIGSQSDFLTLGAISAADFGVEAKQTITVHQTIVG